MTSLVDWLRRVIEPPPHKATLPRVESTRTELRQARMERLRERRRTDRFAQLLNDYRRQDGVLRR